MQGRKFARDPCRRFPRSHQFGRRLKDLRHEPFAPLPLALEIRAVHGGGGFDLGQMKVRGNRGEAVLGIYNEFMTADFDGKRVATFPAL